MKKLTIDEINKEISVANQAITDLICKLEHTTGLSVESINKIDSKDFYDLGNFEIKVINPFK